MRRRSKRTAARVDLYQEWMDTVAEFESRIGVKISDLEAGNELAAKVAGRNLRKDFIRLMSKDIERGNT